MDSERTPGQRAYMAYYESMRGKSPHSNGRLDLWPDLSQRERTAWECAGGQVRRDTLHEITAVLQTFVGEAGL